MADGSSRKAFEQSVRQALPNASIDFADDSTSVESLVQQALQARATMIVAGGGDGTVNAVASAIVGTNIVLGVLPLGTLNHFAKDLGMPEAIADSLAVLASGNVLNIDVGKVNDRFFVNNSGLGLYPDMVFNREGRQRHGSSKWLAAVIESVSALNRYHRLHVKIEIDGKTINRRTPAIFVGNNEYEFTATGQRQRPSLIDGKLCLYVPHPRSRFKLLWFCVRAFLGDPKSDGDFDRFLSASFSITTHHLPLHLSLDGEVTEAVSPLRFESVPGALRVVVPDTDSETETQVKLVEQS